MGIPVKRINSLIWALSAAVATIAGVLLSPVSLVDPSIGFLGIKAFGHEIRDAVKDEPAALKLELGGRSLLWTYRHGLRCAREQAQIGRMRPRRYGLDHPR